jgi:hypothetical protein
MKKANMPMINGMIPNKALIKLIIENFFAIAIVQGGNQHNFVYFIPSFHNKRLLSTKTLTLELTKRR